MRNFLDERPASRVRLVGGRLCLDFVNSVGARRVSANGKVTIRDEKLGDYLDLLAWARHAAALTERESNRLASDSASRAREAAMAFRRALRLREALYGIFSSIILKKRADRLHLDVLNDELRLARSAERLVAGKDSFAWQWHPAGASLHRVVGMVARSAADLLTQGDLTRLQECEGDDCGWIFEDTSRNRGRRWCDMRDCGNVAKVRRFRGRQKKAGEFQTETE